MLLPGIFLDHLPLAEIIFKPRFPHQHVHAPAPHPHPNLKPSWHFAAFVGAMSISILALQEPVGCVCGNRKWSLSKDEIFGRLRELAPGTAPSASPQLKTLHFNKLSCTTSQSLHQLCCDAASAKLGLHTGIEIVTLCSSRCSSNIEMFWKSALLEAL